MSLASSFLLHIAFRNAFALGQRLEPADSELVTPAMTFIPTLAIQNDARIAIQVTAHDLEKLETELWLRKQI